MNQKTKKAWVVWINSDLTEGRGFNVPLAVCDLEATARRLAHKASTQGSDGTVECVELQQVDGHWYGPVVLTPPTREDKKRQAQLDAAHAAEEKARSAGLTPEDIAAIKYGWR